MVASLVVFYAAVTTDTLLTYNLRETLTSLGEGIPATLGRLVPNEAVLWCCLDAILLWPTSLADIFALAHNEETGWVHPRRRPTETLLAFAPRP
jgi:hypothetical protein